MPISGSANADLAFISRGYTNWKDARGKKRALNNHQCSTCHKIATEVMVTLPKTVQNVRDLLLSSHAEEKHGNRGYLLTVVRFLTLQDLGLRRDGPEET